MILKGIYLPTTRTGKRGFKKDKYYNSKEWKDLRSYKFSLNPLCEDCLEENRVTETHTIDHIIPRSQGGPDTIENLRSRCKEHNMKKTRADRQQEGRYNPLGRY